MIDSKLSLPDHDPGKSLHFSDDELVIQSLRIVDASATIPNFGSTEKWDLKAAGLAPNQPRTAATVKFSKFHGTWNLLARELAMILLNPNHPILVMKGLSGKTKPAKTRTVCHKIEENFWHVYRWARETGRLETIDSWGSTEVEDFIRFVSLTRAKSTVQADVGAFRMLHTYHQALTGGGMPNEPWHESITNSERVGYRVSGDLRTKPLAPDEWRAVVSAAWLYVDDFSNDIFDARTRLKAPYNSDSSSNVKVRRSVQRMLLDPETKIQIHPSTAGGANSGKADYQALIFEATGRRWLQPKSLLGPSIVREVQRLVSEGRICHGPEVKFLVGSGNGPKRAWREPIVNSSQLAQEESHLRAACYLIISAFTMMRDSEIQGIKSNPVVDHYGSPAIKSVVIKHDRTERERYWWAADPVIRAIEVLSIQSNSNWLFSRQKSSVENRHEFPPGLMPTPIIQKFLEHINDRAEDWGLATIKTAVNSRRLRRTMAVIAGSAEDGTVAVAIQLKHATNFAIANSLSSAYAEPNAVWEREFHSSRATRSTLHLLDLWDSSVVSNTPFATGPGRNGAREVIRGLTEVSGAKFEGVFGDEHLQARLLKRGLGRVRLGAVVHCLGDPQVAACLSQAEKDRGDTPKPIKCAPDRCVNSFATADHFALLRSEKAQLEQRVAKTTHVDSKVVISRQIDEINRILEVGDDD